MRTIKPLAEDVAAPSAPRDTELSSRPSYLLAITTATIFILEALVMLVLYVIPPIPYYLEAIIDGLLLSSVVFPVLYLAVFKPLKKQIELRVQADAEKDELIGELQNALEQIRTLEGIIPICASCNQIRDDEGYWHRVEAYIEARSTARFSHGICPDCIRKQYPDVPVP